MALGPSQRLFSLKNILFTLKNNFQHLNIELG